MAVPSSSAMFLWAADTHFDTAERSPVEVAREWARQYPEARGLLHSGDVAEASSLLATLRQLRDGLGKPVFFVLGNHDYWGASFDTLDAEVGRWQVEGLHHLAGGSVALGRGVTLVGNGGWYDARYGLVPELGMNDFDRIGGLERPIEASRARADRLAARLADDLERAREDGARRLIVVTHVPPFEELARKADFCAWYGSRASEEILAGAAERFEHVLVLCGHTHLAGHCRRTRLDAYSGEARRGRPVLAGLVDEVTLRVTRLD